VGRQAAVAVARIAFSRDDAPAALAALRSVPVAGLPPAGVYLLGLAREETGDREGALSAYARYGSQLPVMSDVAAMARGNVLFALDRFDEAASAYDNAFASTPDDTTRFVAALRKGNCVLRTAGLTETLGAYATAYAAAADDDQRGQALAGQLAAYVAAGDPGGAERMRRRLVRELPESAAAAVALSDLEASSVPPTAPEAAAVDVAQGRYAVAAARLRAALDSLSGPQPELRLRLARALDAAGEANAALAALQPLRDTAPSPDLAWLQAELIRELGRTGEVESAYRQFAQDFPADSRASGALWRLARSLEERDATDEAAATYADVGRRYPASAEGMEAAFRAGLLWWRDGDGVRAEAQWSTLRDAGADQTRSRALFWLGRLHFDAGDTAGARNLWESARGADPGGFYALAAEARLSGATNAAGAARPLHATDVTEGPAIDEAELARWLSDGVPGFTPEAWDASRARVAAMVDVQRAAAWWEIGERKIAVKTLHRAVDALSASPPDEAVLAAWADERSFHDVAISAATRAMSSVAAPAPPAVDRLRYPTPYRAIAEGEARHAGLSTALLYGLVRQESRFEPTAVSSVGARGLTQVMPATGRSIAAQLGMPSFEIGMLDDPAVALRFGAFYVSAQLTDEEGGMWRALAAYNGGPGNASRWWSAADGDPELFVELIDFAETRRFVRLVTENVRMYERLYPELGGK
jgi:soluble lytic murein transglycosylase